MNREQTMTDTRKTTTKAPQNTTLVQALELFLLDRRARGLASSTLEFYQDRLRPFLAYLQDQGIVTLDDLTAAHIRAYLVTLQARPLSAYSQHAAARSIRALLNFCILEELLEQSPMRKVRMPKLPQEILPAFTATEIRALLAACNDSDFPERDHAMVLALLDTGCRAKEFVALNVGDVDARTGAVTVHQGKGAKDRTTALGSQARRALRKYLALREDAQPTDPLWLNRDGLRLKAGGLREVMVRLGARADVKCYPHKFRRTCAVTMYRSGARLTEIAQLLGHSNLQVLQRYLALHAGDAQAAHVAHGAVNNLLKGR
jgi:site-specific recombinase XerD